MKKKFLILLLGLIVGLAVPSWAQDENNDDDDQQWSTDIPEVTDNAISSMFGYTMINDQPYVSFRLKPELSFGKLGLGLDMPLTYGLADHSLRLDEYQDGIGWLRMIRYVRWGHKKRDNVYFRIGELRDAQLGFGMLITNYNNTISYEKRTLGVEFDVVVKQKYGLEFLYSDINPVSLNLMGIRPYYKPFGASGIPIIKTFEIGASFVTDHDKTVLARTTDDAGNTLEYRNNYFLNDGINAFSVDMGLYIFRRSWLWWDVYAQAGYISRVRSDSLSSYLTTYGDSFQQSYLNSTGGMGWSIGSDFKFRFLGNLLRINARAEKFWHSNYYIPRFFDFAYMMDKDAAILQLTNTHETKGTYAMLKASVLDKVFFETSITFDSLVIDNDHPATVVAKLDMSRLSDKLTLQTSVYNAEVTSFSDLLKLHEKMLFTTRIGYMVYELPIVKLQFHAGFDYRWTFANVYKLSSSATAQDWFRQTKYVTPYFSIKYPLGKKDDKKKKKSEEDELFD